MTKLNWKKIKDNDGDWFWEATHRGQRYTIWVVWSVPVAHFVASGLEAGDCDFASLRAALAACEADHEPRP